MKVLVYCHYFKVRCRLVFESLTNTNESNLTKIPMHFWVKTSLL